MTKQFSFSAWRGASLSLGAAACLAFALGATPAGAARCAKGQFYRASKKTCIDKAEAVKLGLYHGPVTNEEKAGEQPAETQADETLPEPTEAAMPAAPPEAPAPPPSPYGELVLEEFAKAQ